MNLPFSNALALPTDPSELESRKIALFDQIQSIEAGITAEEEKRQKWKVRHAERIYE